MNSLLKKLKIEFNETKKPQSLQTLNELIQAAEVIVNSGDVGSFGARSLSKVSGYSLGSLINRLGKIENIFLYAITAERSKFIKAIGEALVEIDPKEDVSFVVSQFADLAIDAIAKVNPSVMRYYEKRAALRANNISEIFSYSDEVIPYLNKILESNQSKTFRSIPGYEKPFIARAMFLFLERPFSEGDPIAGSPEHKAMATNALISILKA